MFADRLDGVGSGAAGFPAGAATFAGPPRHERDLVGDHESRVEADTELPDKLRRCRRRVLRVLHPMQKFGGTGFRDGADELDHLVA